MVDRTRDDATPVGEADENDVAQVLVENVIDDVTDVRREIYQRTREVTSFPDAGE